MSDMDREMDRADHERDIVFFETITKQAAEISALRKRVEAMEKVVESARDALECCAREHADLAQNLAELDASERGT